MADTTTVRIDEATRDRLKALAAARDLSVGAYLAELAMQEENQQRLAQATASFDAALERPGFADAFDARFGGLPTRDQSTQRAA